ncbi:hypothetical protein Tco_1256816 [Tanacetum coccineum]
MRSGRVLLLDPPEVGVDYRFVSTLDAEERRRGIREVGYGIRDLGTGSSIGRIIRSTMRIHGKYYTQHITESPYGHPAGVAYFKTESRQSLMSFNPPLSMMQQAEMAELRETDRRRQAQIVETLCVKRHRLEDGDHEEELLALRRAAEGGARTNQNQS